MIGANAHAGREHAEVDSLALRFYLLARMVVELGKGQ